MQVTVTFSLIVVLWVVYGYSLAFTEGNAFIGGFEPADAVSGVLGPVAGSFAPAATFSKGVVHPRDRVRRLPGHVCGHHLLPDRRCLRRAHQVQRGAGLHDVHVVHLQLLAPIAHMVWFWMGPDAYTQRRSGGRGLTGKAGLIWQLGCAGLCRRHRGAHQRRRRRPGGCLHGGQARGLRQGCDHPAQPAADDDRCRAAVGGLVRLQRRLGPGSQRLCRPGLHQHLRRHGGGGAGLVPARALLRKGKASMLGAASGAVAGWWPSPRPRAMWASSVALWSSASDRRLRLPVGRDRPEAPAQGRRLAGRVRCPRCGRHRGSACSLGCSPARALGGPEPRWAIGSRPPWSSARGLTPSPRQVHGSRPRACCLTMRVERSRVPSWPSRSLT